MCNKDFVYGSEIERLGVRGRPLARCGDTLGRKEKCKWKGYAQGSVGTGRTRDTSFMSIFLGQFPEGARHSSYEQKYNSR